MCLIIILCCALDRQLVQRFQKGWVRKLLGPAALKGCLHVNISVAPRILLIYQPTTRLPIHNYHQNYTDVRMNVWYTRVICELWLCVITFPPFSECVRLPVVIRCGAPANIPTSHYQHDQYKLQFTLFLWLLSPLSHSQWKQKTWNHPILMLTTNCILLPIVTMCIMYMHMHND